MSTRSARFKDVIILNLNKGTARRELAQLSLHKRTTDGGGAYNPDDRPPRPSIGRVYNTSAVSVVYEYAAVRVFSYDSADVYGAPRDLI